MQDALYSKKELISSEITLLKISKAIEKYNLYRQTELALKIKMFRKIQEVKEDIEAIKQHFPKPKVPKEHEEEVKEVIPVIKEIKLKEDASVSLEKQLEEIQARLREFD